MSLYEIFGLTKKYGDRVVLDMAQLSFDKGRIYALLGGNGTGKTTLLNILAFLDRPTTGKILFSSSNVRFVEKELLVLRRQVIMLDQHPILFSTSVYKNLEFGLKIRKIGGRERGLRIEAALDMVGMLKFKEEQAANLSGGETQRVALARVLVLRPSVLLCDEPTASVDAANQIIIQDLLKELNSSEKMSVIFSTHDHDLASRLADSTIHLD